MVDTPVISSRTIFPDTLLKRKYCNGRMQIAGRCTAKKALDAFGLPFDR
jgi:hypothetical protein